MKIAGTEVKDADDKLIVTITKADVRSGAKKNSQSCAAANALCRQHHAEEARVHFSRAYIKKNGKWLRFGVPAALRNEILAFDRGGEFAPGEYVLSPVQPCVRLDAPTMPKHSGRPDKRRNHKNKNMRKRAYHVVSGVRARMMADWE